MQQGIRKTIGGWPVFGCGVGLRQEHYSHVLRHWPKMDWFEIVTENYLDTGGRPQKVLEQVSARYPVAFHGVALSIGSVDPINPAYLKKLKKLTDEIDPFVVSDHLCWTGVGQEQLHDLLPLPFTQEAIEHIVRRVDQVQDYLGRRILLENVSSYLTYSHSVIPEWEFHRIICKRTGSGILLDLNNVYVNSRNHGFDAMDFLNGIPVETVGQFHLAGHTDRGEYLFDTHNKEIIHPVWELYDEALKRYGQLSTLIEWDADIPGFERLSEEAQKAKTIYKGYQNHQPEDNQNHRIDSSACFSDKPEVPSLQQVQMWFKGCIQPRETKTPEFEHFLNPQGSVRGIERTHVYADGYLARNEEALTEVYEAIKHLLGEKTFHALAADYAGFHRSTNYNISRLGREFPEFLMGHPILQEFPFLSDLASLEWAVAEAFHAHAKPLLDPQRFASLPVDAWDQAKLVFQDHVLVLSSVHPIYDLWEAKTKEVHDIKIDLRRRPQNVLVARRGMTVFCRLLTQAQYEFLNDLLTGKTLGQACERLSGRHNDTQDLGSWLSQWVQSGLLSEVEVREALTRQD